jgi:hypothetical protein
VPGVWYLVVRVHSSRVRQVSTCLGQGSGWWCGQGGLAEGSRAWAMAVKSAAEAPGGPAGQDSSVDGQVLAGDER